MLGSDAYFSNARKDLEALMEGKGMPTLWFTFSAADNYWTDLHEISVRELIRATVNTCH